LDNLEDTLPVFSPDGERLAFARKYLNQDEWTPGRQLWLMDMDGGNARSLTREPSYNHYDFAWSPLGNQLAFVRFNQTTMTEPPELWLVNDDGSQARLLVIGGYAPQWIP
jgi:Tol biopolymer transport system component